VQPRRDGCNRGRTCRELHADRKRVRRSARPPRHARSGSVRHSPPVRTARRTRFRSLEALRGRRARRGWRGGSGRGPRSEYIRIRALPRARLRFSPQDRAPADQLHREGRMCASGPTCG
jgi:hypothetical protein